MLIPNNTSTKIIGNRKPKILSDTNVPIRDQRRLRAALKDGWQILEAARYLAHGVNSEGNGYLLTLFHPRRLQTIEYNISRSADIDAILAFEGVPGYIG